MKAFVLSSVKAALVMAAYLALHYSCAWWLSLSAAGYTICANMAALALVLVCGWIRRVSPTVSIGSRRISATTAIAAAGLGVGLCVMVQVMMLTVPFPDAWTQHYTERVDAVQQAPAAVVLVSSLIVAPLVEEVVFRGLIFRTLRNGMPCVVAMVLSSAAFAVLHGTIVWILYTFVLGLLLAWLYARTTSVWACVLCHLAFNVAGRLSLVRADWSLMSMVSAAVGVIMLALSFVLVIRTSKTE